MSILAGRGKSREWRLRQAIMENTGGLVGGGDVSLLSLRSPEPRSSQSVPQRRLSPLLRATERLDFLHFLRR